MVLVRTSTPQRRNLYTSWSALPLFREMENMLRDLSDTRPGLGGHRAFPAVNVTSNEDNYFLRAELPGLDAEALDISVDQNTVTIKGQRTNEIEGEGVSFHRRERTSGTFARAITLPSDIDADSVDASYRNGLLTVTVPKAPETKPRQITVHAN